MHAFVALIWDETDDDAHQCALRLWKLAKTDLPPAGILEIPGCILTDLDHNDDTRKIIPLTAPQEQPAGAIYGHLYSNSERDEVSPRLNRIDSAAAAGIIGSMGGALIRNYWGSYIAILKHGPRWQVITDPTAAIPCFHMEHSGVTIVFSHLEKCPFLHRLELTINYEFLSKLLIYDKISNGETGFHQISELPGGSRLSRTPQGVTTTLLWDPRRIASDRLEPPLEQAAAMLLETTQSVIASRADGHDTVTVNLSGGLDSSIVLACLAGSAFGGDLQAVHHIVASGDPSEVRYARAAAEAAGCPLTELLFEPGPDLPDVCAHPLTVRPWRQFLSTTQLDGYPADRRGRSGPVFTGQGGDHLFLVSETDAGFADYLTAYGPGPSAITELVSAARLSGRSVWSVAGRALRTRVTRQRESEMVRTLRTNRNPLNDSLHITLDPGRCLPPWAVHPDGVPPGKFDQLSALQHLFMIREPLDRPVLRDLVHPLISQPVIELCLKFPLYLLCSGGVSRGLAREAFRGRIPDLIRTRLTKGETSRYVIAGLQKDLPVISEALREGCLVSQGLIPRADLEKALANHQVQTGKLVRRLRMAYAIEAWVRSWQNAIRRHGTSGSRDTSS